MSDAYTPDTIKRFRELFSGRDDRYGHWNPVPDSSGKHSLWTEGKRDANNKIIYDSKGNTLPAEPLTDKKILEHLTGVMGLGLVPITASGKLRFAALDIDKDDIDHIELARRVKNCGLPMYVCRSKSGAAHVYIFFSGDGMDAKRVMKSLKDWSVALGCGTDLPIAEIFPKQSHIDNADVGNWINLPFFNDVNNGPRYYVTPEGGHLGLEAFLAVAKQFNSSFALPIAVRSESFNQGPPCLETLMLKGIGAGHRNNTLYNVGVYYKKAFPNEWESMLHTFNEKHLTPKLEDRDVEVIIKSMKRKDYRYKCKEEPIASVCEPALCEGRMYGIISQAELLKKKAMNIQMPITSLKKFNSVPAKWQLMVNEIPVMMEATDILNYNGVRKFLFDALNIVPPKMEQSVWEAKVTQLLQAPDFEVVDVGDDKGEYSLAINLIDEFVRNGRCRPNALRYNDCYLEYDEENRGSHAYAKTKDVRMMLKNNNISLKPHEVTVALKQTGWEPKVKYVPEGGTHRVWYKYYPNLIPNEKMEEAEIAQIGRQVDECHSGATP
jgi:hypothetical protein